MKRYRIKGFVMADSILALTVVTLGIVTLLTAQQQLSRQQGQHDARLIAARLAKESSDQLVATGRPAIIERGGYRARATLDQVTVYHGSRLVVLLRK
ncbi:hypothetical protein [Limosilactobacillus pontis]|nr:hypothetical protein [Limosilactobacillus pontis]MCX2186811.1 hypothetical protein [Limosilactobacillus pontis]MCX2188611.1 hypothetical protein [Limosilactobacillus pontis]